MKKSFLIYILLPMTLTVNAFAQSTNSESINVTVDQILAAKRVVISPVQYKGYFIRNNVGAKKLCQFLGYSSVETYSESYLNREDRYKTVSVSDTGSGIHVDNSFDYGSLDYETYFTSITCLK